MDDDKTVEVAPHLLEIEHDFKGLRRYFLSNVVANIDPVSSEIIHAFENEYLPSNTENDFQLFFKFIKDKQPEALIDMFMGLRTKGFFKKEIEEVSYLDIGFNNLSNLEENAFLAVTILIINPLIEKHGLVDYFKRSRSMDRITGQKLVTTGFLGNMRGMLVIDPTSNKEDDEKATRIVQLWESVAKSFYEFILENQEEVAKMEGKRLKRHNQRLGNI